MTDLATRVLKTLSFEYCDSLFFRTDDDQLSFYINCNDTFMWGCADAEQVTEENIDLLEQTYAECEQLFGKYRATWADLLFVARSRGMRPQGAMYAHFSPEWDLLFDACGPERVPGLGNPYSQHERPSRPTIEEAKLRIDAYRMCP